MSKNQQLDYGTRAEQRGSSGSDKVQNGTSTKRRLLRKLFFVSGDLLLTYASFYLTHLLCCGLVAQTQVLLSEDVYRLFNLINLNRSSMWLFSTCLAGLVFFIFGFYRQLWRFASIPEYLNLVFGTFFFALLQYALTRFMSSQRPVSQGNRLRTSLTDS